MSLNLCPRNPMLNQCLCFDLIMVFENLWTRREKSKQNISNRLKGIDNFFFKKVMTMKN